MGEHINIKNWLKFHLQKSLRAQAQVERTKFYLICHNKNKLGSILTFGLTRLIWVYKNYEILNIINSPAGHNTEWAVCSTYFLLFSLASPSCPAPHPLTLSPLWNYLLWSSLPPTYKTELRVISFFWQKTIPYPKRTNLYVSAGWLPVHVSVLGPTPQSLPTHW